MERSTLRQIRLALRSLGRRRLNRRYTFTDATILEVYLFAVLHERPVCWACDPDNWPPGRRRGPMPSASTISRRMRTESLAALAEQLLETLSTQHLVQRTLDLVAAIDGKALPIGPHSHDKHASWGRSTSGKAKGYKLHAIVTTDSRVLAWRVAPMHIDERVMARRMLKNLEHSGYLLADGNYDSNKLFDAALERGIQFVAPRRGAPTSRLSKRRHSPARLRSKDMLESDRPVFGRSLMRERWSIERFFGSLSANPGGLSHLPAWVRSWRRVHNWVAGKLILHAARAASRREALMQ